MSIESLPPNCYSRIIDFLPDEDLGKLRSLNHNVHRNCDEIIWQRKCENFCSFINKRKEHSVPWKEHFFT